VDLWIAYCRQQNEIPNLLDEAFDNLAMDAEKATSIVSSAIQCRSVDERIKTLQSALAVYRKSKSLAFYSKVCISSIAGSLCGYDVLCMRLSSRIQ
jgi:hypothetical protein